VDWNTSHAFRHTPFVKGLGLPCPWGQFNLKKPSTDFFSVTGEKKFTLEEFLPIYSQELKDKDQGVYEDFLECLKLYDKQEDGTMLGAELHHILISLGETR
jgi:Ca2+-binding protein (EF-Hand superfamily)